MKKFMLLALTSAAFAGLASAATVSVLCGSADVDGAVMSGTPTLSATITCPSFASLVAFIPGGSTYQDTTVGTQSSVTGIFGQGVGSAVMTFSGGGFTYTPLTNNVATNTADIIGSTDTLVGIGSLASFGVSYSVTSFTPSAIGQSTGSVGVIYNYTTVQNGVPEPATAGLLGGALVALGLIARKRK
jgi:hypothetical protein